MERFDVNSSTYLDLAEKLMVKIVNLKSTKLLGCQNKNVDKDMF